MIQISEASERELKDFAEFPYSLYKSYKFWVPPLKNDTLALLSLSHPFWKNAERKLFIARKNGRIAGTIAAIANRAHNEYHNDKCGFFGFFEAENDEEITSSLLAAARLWLKKQGMEKMRGPMNPSVNQTCGLLISGFDSYPKIMMPYNPPYYAEHFQNCGLVKAKDLLAYMRFTQTPVSERIAKILSRVERSDFRLRTIRLGEIEKELETARQIYNDAWSENWSFTPMSREEMAFTAHELKPVLKPDHVWFLEVDSEPAAFSLTIPDVNIALRGMGGKLTLLNALPFLLRLRKIKQGRLLTLGVKKKFRNRGLELALIKRVIDTSAKLGWDGAELSWILEDNEKIIRIIEEVGGMLYKKYRIYETQIKSN